ncbi:hypothetical protein [Schaalia vaccimaxillae]|uniref:hypothetical protein n=1 Tax=Schaalia vaccimaxillae TaxID=183916 RepID=UPI0003B30268|nr:hypothetical protein [Schaalia vaccimaxillae]
MPFLLVMAGLALVSFFIYTKKRPAHFVGRHNYFYYAILVVPLLCVVGYFWAKEFAFTPAFFMPLVGTICIGIGEELLVRGMMFKELLRIQFGAAMPDRWSVG